MSMFSNNITPSVNKTDKEWNDIIYHEYFYTCYMEWLDHRSFFNSNDYPFEDYVRDYIIDDKYRTKSGFKKYLSQVRNIDNGTKRRWEKTFQRIWEHYGVMFEYKLQYLKGQKFINGIRFIKVLG